MSYKRAGSQRLSLSVTSTGRRNIADGVIGAREPVGKYGGRLARSCQSQKSVIMSGWNGCRPMNLEDIVTGRRLPADVLREWLGQDVRRTNADAAQWFIERFPNTDRGVMRRRCFIGPHFSLLKQTKVLR